ncbi:cuticle protein 16.8-like [Dermacentor albipictus]|uniref:cuticle protein 16.8-like n=1 Tax=Dermacentor albipictus TaxID=60249 RepID=UPI0031FDAFFC
MFSKVVLCCLLAIAASAPVEEYPPQPYSFSFDNTDEYGTRLTREETGDANNNKVGSYSYTDATGISRTVKYTADAEGFHVTVETNEPGTKSSNPADVLYTSSAVDVAPAPAAPVVAKPVEVKPVVAKPVVVQAAQAPVAVHAVHAVHPVHALHPVQYAAPVAFATAHHVTPVTFVHQAPFTVGKAKA